MNGGVEGPDVEFPTTDAAVMIVCPGGRSVVSGKVKVPF